MFRWALDAALLSDDPTASLWQVIGSDACQAAFPEPPARAMDGDPRHKDVLDHSIRVAAKTPRRLPVRLAALCHDIGKPDTREFDGAEVTFRNHETVGAKMLRDRLPQLGYPAELIDQVATVVAMSGRFKSSDDQGGWSDAAVRRFVRDAGDSLTDLLDLIAVDVTSKHVSKHEAQREQVERIRARIAEVEARDRAKNEQPDLDGSQVMAYLEIGPGPQVGQAMQQLLDARRRAGRALTEAEAYQLLDRLRQAA